MAQETYQTAKAVLKRIQNKKHTDGQILNFLSPSAIVACSNAAQNLKHLSITAEEQEIYDESNTIEGVQEFIQQYVAEVEKKQTHKKAWKKVYTFSRFAGPVLDVFKQANFTPECSVALGFLGILLIQPLNNKSEIEDRLETEVEQLHEILAQVKFSKSNIKTAEIENEIQGLCAAIIDFLVHALQYQKKWGIVKVLNSIIADFARRFQVFVRKIQGHANKIEVLAQRGYTTTLLDTRAAIQDLQLHATTQATIFDVRISRLENSISQCKQAIENSSRFSAILHVQRLCAIMFSTQPSLELDTLMIRQQETLLTQKEHWKSNVSEIQAPEWLSQTPRPILWIGGRKNKRNVSWVSSFTLDLVDAMQVERGVQVICTLCNGQEGGVRTPLGAFKSAVVQVLKAHPEMVLDPINIEMLSLQRFESVRESPEVAYKLLVDVLRMANEKCKSDRTELFWVIDRLDVVLTRENVQGRRRFTKALRQLAAEFPSLRIIVTSQFMVNEMEVVMDKQELMEIWTDASRPLGMHSRH